MAKTTTDEKVKQLFDLVQEKKLAIEKAERPCWETSGNFGYSANSGHDRVNIQTVTDEELAVATGMMGMVVINNYEAIRSARKQCP